MDMTTSSSSIVHYPVVDENMTPRLGMHFDYLDEAYNLYNAYGKLAGFSIRKESSNRGKDGEVVWKRFVYSKEGKTDEKHWIGKELVQRRRMEIRFDCKAKLQVKLDKSGGYVVSMFVPQHSHAPATPSCNHHGQITLFGCGFLPNEKMESFEWLFNTWLEAMSYSPPKGIITDQDLAMTKAIKNVMPNTDHRFWNQIIADNKLMENDWLADIFKIRHMWVPAYLKKNFFGGMSTTQRSESMNSFAKQYVEYKNSLLDFILPFDTRVERLRYLEKKEDFENSNGRPKMKTCSLMEKQMAEVYTRNIFYKFQDELFTTMSVAENIVYKDDVDCKFVVKNYSDEKEIEREVLWKKDEKHAYCSYKKFEFEDIPCCHVLSILRRGAILFLPERYILKRWTKGVTRDAFLDVVESGGPEGVDPCLARHSHLSCKFARLIDIASQSKECFEFLISDHGELEMKLRQMMLNNPLNSSIDKGKAVVDSNVVEYDEPAHVVTKGRSKRLKSSKEKATKGCLCKGCNKRGVSHDKRICPVLLNRLVDANPSQSLASIDESRESSNEEMQ
ncbi:protein FAR-RED IMPAIRED RESPONSE 1-like protein [Cinnamomum micranthum f. kanehirae]|uniref:Protein FAR1-RELATED SEQUENCE n=1 Tax=Cinnamomum micranthum f. kanehirae TaxID=337451 RepID=A0A443PN82_9MAGN|nr:protein FAR-RED IMPAIRED RESPONSE 1-like protein [Cinnamomum micranthum f. kanehirae]